MAEQNRTEQNTQETISRPGSPRVKARRCEMNKTSFTASWWSHTSGPRLFDSLLGVEKFFITQFLWIKKLHLCKCLFKQEFFFTSQSK